MADTTADYLRILVSLLGRTAFPLDRLAGIVASGGAREKQVQAFNLCDGSKSQSEIAKELSIDTGNFSRTVARWVEAGIVFRVGGGREGKLLHVYPLPREPTRANKTKE